MLNRSMLLQCVRKHLDESQLSAGSVRALGEVLPPIAAELRSGRSSSDANYRGIVSIALVAAFVDGDVTDEESEFICQAIHSDNSLLSEIIAAVRAKDSGESSADPLSESLQARLLGMMPSSHIEQKVAISNIVLRDPLTEISPTTWTKSLPWVGLTLLAASLLTMVWISMARDSNKSSTNEIVEIDRKTIPPDTTNPEADPRELVPRNPVDVSKNQVDQMAVDLKTPSPIDDPQQAVASGSTLPESFKEMKVDPPTSNHSPTVAGHRFAELHWTKIHGLLIQKSETKEVSEDSARIPWSGVELGRNEKGLDLVQETRLATLPLSRAEGTLDANVRMVLASDSEIALSVKDDGLLDITLDRGSMALLDVPEGGGARVRVAGNIVATLRWESHANAVVGIGTAGLQVQIDRGNVHVNDRLLSDEIAVVHNDRLALVSERAVRMPGWVTKPVETISIPKTILAQFSRSDHVMNSILQSMDDVGTQDLSRLTLLARWYSAIAEDQLYRLLGDTRPLIRIAALERMVQIHSWDPLFRRVWSQLEMGRPPIQTMRLQTIVEHVRQGVPLNAEQHQALLVELESTDASARSLSDYLLRRNWGGGPNFDPFWTGQTQTRGIGLWRRYLSAKGVR